jgi:hypothetical protein
MRISFALAASLLLVIASVTTATAAESVTFQGELHHFTPPAGTCDGGVCEYESHGYGFTNLMGSITVDVEFTWDFTTSPCSTLDPLVFSLVGATGSVAIEGSGVVCDAPEPSGFLQFFSGTGEVTGGTGEFAGISGSVTFQGVLAKRGPVVHMSGPVSF